MALSPRVCGLKLSLRGCCQVGVPCKQLSESVWSGALLDEFYRLHVPAFAHEEQWCGLSTYSKWLGRTRPEMACWCSFSPRIPALFSLAFGA